MELKFGDGLTHVYLVPIEGRMVFGGKYYWGWYNFIPLKTLRDPSKGYLVGSNCIVKADITVIGSTNDA